MRLHYYRFPEGMSAHERYKAGADSLRGDCTESGRDTCRGCPFNYGDGYRGCDRYVCLESDETICGVSITRAKELLKEYGGAAWTCHIDRDGGCFETTAIKLKGDNSRHKYNRHL